MVLSECEPMLASASGLNPLESNKLLNAEPNSTVVYGAADQPPDVAGAGMSVPVAGAWSD